MASAICISRENFDSNMNVSRNPLDLSILKISNANIIPELSIYVSPSPLSMATEILPQTQYESIAFIKGGVPIKRITAVPSPTRQSRNNSATNIRSKAGKGVPNEPAEDRRISQSKKAKRQEESQPNVQLTRVYYQEHPNQGEGLYQTDFVQVSPYGQKEFKSVGVGTSTGVSSYFPKTSGIHHESFQIHQPIKNDPSPEPSKVDPTMTRTGFISYPLDWLASADIVLRTQTQQFPTRTQVPDAYDVFMSNHYHSKSMARSRAQTVQSQVFDNSKSNACPHPDPADLSSFPSQEDVDKSAQIHSWISSSRKSSLSLSPSGIINTPTKITCQVSPAVHGVPSCSSRPHESSSLLSEYLDPLTHQAIPSYRLDPDLSKSNEFWDRPLAVPEALKACHVDSKGLDIFISHVLSSTSTSCPSRTKSQSKSKSISTSGETSLTNGESDLYDLSNFGFKIPQELDFESKTLPISVPCDTLGHEINNYSPSNPAEVDHIGIRPTSSSSYFPHSSASSISTDLSSTSFRSSSSSTTSTVKNFNDGIPGNLLEAPAEIKTSRTFTKDEVTITFDENNQCTSLDLKHVQEIIQDNFDSEPSAESSKETPLSSDITDIQNPNNILENPPIPVDQRSSDLWLGRRIFEIGDMFAQFAVKNQTEDESSAEVSADLEDQESEIFPDEVPSKISMVGSIPQINFTLLNQQIKKNMKGRILDKAIAEVAKKQWIEIPNVFKNQKLGQTSASPHKYKKNISIASRSRDEVGTKNPKVVAKSSSRVHQHNCTAAAAAVSARSKPYHDYGQGQGSVSSRSKSKSVPKQPQILKATLNSKNAIQVKPTYNYNCNSNSTPSTPRRIQPPKFSSTQAQSARKIPTPSVIIPVPTNILPTPSKFQSRIPHPSFLPKPSAKLPILPESPRKLPDAIPSQNKAKK